MNYEKMNFIDDNVTRKIIKNLAGFLRQVYPHYCNGSDLQIAQFTMISYIDRRGYELPSLLPILTGKNACIEALEEMYERGFSAIINDGKLVGFVIEKENA